MIFFDKEIIVHLFFMYMVYGYIRVSSDKQTVENQRFEINKFCEKQNIADVIG